MKSKETIIQEVIKKYDIVRYVPLFERVIMSALKEFEKEFNAKSKESSQ